MSIGETCRSAKRAVLDFLFPAECPLCRCACPDAESDAASLCAGCRKKILPRPLKLCLGCGAPLGPYQRPGPQCAHCYQDRFAFSRVWSLGRFEDTLRIAVLRAKSRHGGLLTSALSDLLFNEFRAEWEDNRPDLVLAVPHHWTEKIGVDHFASQSVGQRLAQRLNCGFANGVIVKQNRTRRQASLVPTDRRRNLSNAFRLRHVDRITGKKIMLVDDVLTTGTTAHRVASLLRRTGKAADVRVCVLARGIGQD